MVRVEVVTPIEVMTLGRGKVPAGLLLVLFFSQRARVSGLTLSSTKSSSIWGCRVR